MDKRNKRNEATDKKTEYKAKDRGDLKKVNDKSLRKCEGNTQFDTEIAHPERGDSERKITNNKSEKVQLTVVKKSTNEESKSKYLIHGIAEKEFPSRRNYDSNAMAKSHSELRKRIRDRYTLKRNNTVNKSENIHNNKKEDGKPVGLKASFKNNNSQPVSPKKQYHDPVERPKKKLSEEATQTLGNQNRSSGFTAEIDPVRPDLIPDKKPEKNPLIPDKTTAKPSLKSERKPLVNTVVSNAEPVRIFKAVTFVDHNSNPPTPLEIKIPGSIIKKQQKLSRFTETNTLKCKPKIVVSKVSIIKEKIATVRKKMERKRDKTIDNVSSPACSIREPICPQTEVARWAPASIDNQTKPYYEAWVDTTLAAISKNSMNDKLVYEQQARLLRSFQKSLEARPQSPELFYAKFADEKYTGKIKIRQTDKTKK